MAERQIRNLSSRSSRNRPRASIRALLPPRGPAAIAGCVVAAVVDSVQRGGLWSRSHVEQETFEGVPLLTERDSPASVPTVGRILRIPAAVSGHQPGLVFRRRVAAVGSIHTACRLSLHTPATHGHALSQRAGANGSLRAAVAHSRPHRTGISLPLGGSVQDRPPSESKASQVYFARHRSIISPLSLNGVAA